MPFLESYNLYEPTRRSQNHCHAILISSYLLRVSFCSLRKFVSAEPDLAEGVTDCGHLTWQRGDGLWRSPITHLQDGPQEAPSVPAPGRPWWSHWQWWHSWQFHQKYWLGWLQPEIKSRKMPIKMLMTNILTNNRLRNRGKWKKKRKDILKNTEHKIFNKKPGTYYES